MNVTFKTGPANLLSNEELVVAVAFLGLLQDRIESDGHDVPADIQSEMRKCQTELNERLRGEKQRRLAKLQIQRDSLLPAAEKRKNVEAEIAALELELSGNKAKAKGK